MLEIIGLLTICLAESFLNGFRYLGSGTVIDDNQLYTGMINPSKR